MPPPGQDHRDDPPAPDRCADERGGWRVPVAIITMLVAVGVLGARIFSQSLRAPEHLEAFKPLNLTGPLVGYQASVSTSVLPDATYFAHNTTRIVREDLALTIQRSARTFARALVAGRRQEIGEALGAKPAVAAPEGADRWSEMLLDESTLVLRLLPEPTTNSEAAPRLLTAEEAVSLYLKSFGAFHDVHVTVEDIDILMAKAPDGRPATPTGLKATLRCDVRGLSPTGERVRDLALLAVELRWDSRSKVAQGPAAFGFRLQRARLLNAERVVSTSASPHFSSRTVIPPLPVHHPSGQLPAPEFHMTEEADEVWWGLPSSVMSLDDPLREGLFASGPSAADLDGDGDIDLLIPGLGGTRLLVNDGSGMLSDLTEGSIFARLDRARAALCFDATGDGLPEVLILRAGGHARFLLNRGAMHFEDVTAGCAFANQHIGPAAAVADLDGDGWLDVVAGRLDGLAAAPFSPVGRPALLFRNDGKGGYPTARSLHPASAGRTNALTLTDLNGDGHADLVIAADFRGVIVLHGLGDGNFAPIGSQPTLTVGPNDPLRPAALALLAGDRGTSPALVVAAMGSQAGRRLLPSAPPQTGPDDSRSVQAYPLEAVPRAGRAYRLAPAQGTLTAQPRATGVPDWTMGVTALDYDLDGHQEAFMAAGFFSGALLDPFDSVFFSSSLPLHGAVDWRKALSAEFPAWSFAGHQRDALLRPTPDGSMVDMAYGARCDLLADSRAAVACDLDGDGDEDLVVSQRGGSVRILENLTRELSSRRQQRAHVIVVRLRQPPPNTRGIGSVVRVQCGERSLIRELRCGSGSLAHGPAELIIGLGDAVAIDFLEVTWPNGEAQRWTGLQLDQRIILERDTATAKQAPLSSPSISSLRVQGLFRGIRQGGGSLESGAPGPRRGLSAEAPPRGRPPPSPATTKRPVLPPAAGPPDDGTAGEEAGHEGHAHAAGEHPGSSSNSPPSAAYPGMNLASDMASHGQALFDDLVATDPARRPDKRRPMFRMAQQLVDVLTAASNHEDVDHRAEAIRLLAAVEHPGTEALLRKATMDPSSQVRTTTQMAIARSFDRFRLPLVLKGLEDDSAEVRNAAIEALTSIRPWPSQIFSLLAPISHSDPAVRNTSIESIGAAGAGTTEVLQHLAQFVDDSAWEVRAELAVAVGFLRGYAALDVLRKLAIDPNRSVRFSALHSLGQLPDHGVIDEIEIALEDPQAPVRVVAISAAASSGSTRLLAPLLRRVKEEPAWGLRVRSLEGLGELVNRTQSVDYLPRVIEQLHLCTQHPHVAVRMAAGTALARLGQPEGRQILKREVSQATYETDTRALMAAIGVLGSLRDQTAADMINRLAREDRRDIIAATARRALERIRRFDLLGPSQQPQLPGERPASGRPSEQAPPGH